MLRFLFQEHGMSLMSFHLFSCFNCFQWWFRAFSPVRHLRGIILVCTQLACLRGEWGALRLHVRDSQNGTQVCAPASQRGGPVWVTHWLCARKGAGLGHVCAGVCAPVLLCLLHFVCCLTGFTLLPSQLPSTHSLRLSSRITSSRKPALTSPGGRGGSLSFVPLNSLHLGLPASTIRFWTHQASTISWVNSLK